MLLPYKEEQMLWKNYTILSDEELKETGIYKKYKEGDNNPEIENYEFPPERNELNYNINPFHGS